MTKKETKTTTIGDRISGSIDGTRDLVAKDAREQLRRWDAGEGIWSIEMGGLGPGYEQCIQLLAIEITRDQIDKPLPTGTFDTWGDEAVHRLAHNGFSGAQVGAAKNLAYRWIKEGPAKCLESCPDKDRHIQVSKDWPKA
jgi:hypothetical protein